ncbi:MAG: Tellurite resistance protein TerB [Anaerolineaceae bacterium 4572_78]|nr:MAG: Tellurite resistance protein TerB [Anaerolineaceae bacterium 4572_78]
MGLFDMFRSDKGEQMSPHLAFVASLIYMMAADGVMDNEEVGQLLGVLGGEKQPDGTIGVGAQNRELLRKAQQIVRSTKLDVFLVQIAPILTDAQKMCILTNLVDSSLSDGVAEPEEQVMFEKFMRAFGIPEGRFRPFFEVISLKHDRTVFTDDRHPSNQPGFTVSLSI